MSDVEDLVDDVTDVAEGVLSLGKQKLFAIGGVLSAIFSFIADVLQPIAPIAIYLCIGSGVVFLVCLLFYLKTKKGMVTGIIMLCATVMLGIVTVIQQFTGSTENGFASEMIPGISSVQKSLGLIQKGIEEIKEDTAAIKENTKKIDEKTDDIVESTQKTADAVDKLADKLSDIGDDGIRSNPTTPEDYYHNAKIHELGGDYRNAQKSYKAYFGFKTGKLDPHLRLINFLRANEGRAGALEEYTLMTQGNDSSVVELVKILLKNHDFRAEALHAFYEKNQDYVPVYYYLSSIYGTKLAEQFTLDNVKEEYKWLAKFKEKDDTGELSKFVVDKEVLLEWREDVRFRLKVAEKQLQKINTPVRVLAWKPTNIKLPHDNPSVFFSESEKVNPGLEGVLVFHEAVSEVEIKKRADTEFKSLGHLNAVDPASKKKATNQVVTLSPSELEPQVIKVRYKNVAGKWSDVHDLELREIDVKAFAKNDEGKIEVNPVMLDLCNGSKQQWCSFRDFDSRLLIYFTRVMRYRSIIAEVAYSFDSENLGQKWEYPEYDGLGINPIGSEGKHEVEVQREAPAETKFICVQVTYKNGGKSEVVKIANPHAK